jgi:hypothetical protein
MNFVQSKSFVSIIPFKIFLYKASCKPNETYVSAFADWVWETDGYVDDVATAKRLIAKTNIPIRSQFELAATYCLDSKLEQLYAELTTEDLKVEILN